MGPDNVRLNTRVFNIMLKDGTEIALNGSTVKMEEPIDEPVAWCIPPNHAVTIEVTVPDKLALMKLLGIELIPSDKAKYMYKCLRRGDLYRFKPGKKKKKRNR